MGLAVRPLFGLLTKEHSVVPQIPWKDSLVYTGHLLNIYSAVAAAGLPNFMVVCRNLPSKLHAVAWENLVRTFNDVRVVELPKFRFLASYQGPVPTPAMNNHPSAPNHISDVTSYITMKVQEEAMLGPF